MARTRKDIQRNKRILSDLKAIRGLDRRHHFNTGGTLVEWLGRHDVRPDLKKQRNKTACRRPVQDD